MLIIKPYTIHRYNGKHIEKTNCKMLLRCVTKAVHGYSISLLALDNLCVHNLRGESKTVQETASTFIPSSQLV